MKTWYYEVVSIDGDYANLKERILNLMILNSLQGLFFLLR